MPSDMIRRWERGRVKMKWDWRRAASKTISRNDRRNILAGAVAGLGGAIAIGAMEWFSLESHYPPAVAAALAMRHLAGRGASVRGP